MLLTLLPGDYTIKFLARDAETGRIGSCQTAFRVPNLNREDKRLPISSVYLQAYQPDAAAVRPLIGYVGFYRGQEKVFETQPVEITRAWNNRLKTMPLEFDVPLSGLAPGKYACQVTVLDPAGRKAAFWQAPVVLLQ